MFDVLLLDDIVLLQSKHFTNWSLSVGTKCFQTLLDFFDILPDIMSTVIRVKSQQERETNRSTHQNDDN